MDDPDPIPALKQQLRDELIAQIGIYGQVIGARAVGTSQPRMSDLTRNRLERFSLEMLIRFLTRVNLKVEIRVYRSSLRSPQVFRFRPRPPRSESGDNSV